MFDPAIYRERRTRLKKDVGSGLILLLGNDEVGMNYAANTYHFRQDSTFLYYFAVDLPGLAALIDVDQNTDTLFGDDLTVADIVWTGPQPTIADQGKAGAVAATAPMAELEKRLAEAIAQGRRVHFLKPYRAEHTLKITALLGLKPSIVASYRSEPLHKAVVAQRNIKSAAEVAEIESAIGVSRQMYLAAMAAAKPGKYAVRSGGRDHPCREGERLRPLVSDHLLRARRDAPQPPSREPDEAGRRDGARLGRRDAEQVRERHHPHHSRRRDVHRAAAADLRDGAAGADSRPSRPSSRACRTRTSTCWPRAASRRTSRRAGLMKGDLGEAVAAGAHALFFPHGLGHMIGLDVHDLENMGEQYVGYEPGVERSAQFGLGYLRLARTLKPGFVLTVEPGLYFIPQLIDQWKAEKRNAAFINYKEVEKFRDARGYRIEDDVLVTKSGNRVLGPPIPKTVADVEAACKG